MEHADTRLHLFEFEQLCTRAGFFGLVPNYLSAIGRLLHVGSIMELVASACIGGDAFGRLQIRMLTRLQV